MLLRHVDVFTLAAILFLIRIALAEEDEIEDEDPIPYSVRVESCDG